MRESDSAWAFFSAVLAALAFAVSVSHAGEAAKDAGKNKPKERPFKYDAWCAFSDLMVDRPYVSPNAPIDPETEHVRTGVDKLGGFGRRGQWAHVIVDLKNTTDPERKTVYEGTSSIELNHVKPDDFSTTTYATLFRQAFQVAPQTEKPYHFSIFCPESGWNHSLNVEIMTTGGRPYNRDFKLYDLDEKSEQLIVVVSDQPGAFKFLGPRAKNLDSTDALNLTNEVELGRQIASVTPSELPSRWHDLTLASLIIIDGPPADGLSPTQWEAIKSYAQAGGKVLIMAGKDPNRLKGAVEELAGIVVRASTELPSLDQFDTKFPASADKTKESRVPVIEVTASGAGIVKRNSATQIVEYCAKSYGAGMVAFIPFSLNDRKFEGWPERFTIPMNLVKSEKNLFAVDLEGDEADPAQQNNPYGRRTAKQAGLATLRNALDGSFQDDTPVEKQAPRTVMWFMIIYLVCAVPLNFVIFTLLRRRESGWLAAPIWALTFTIAAYYIGYSGRTGAITVNEVSVVEAGSGQGTGIGRTFMGVYAPRRDDYQIEFPALQISRDEVYETQAAPAHLVNTATVETRGAEFPSMRIYEAGQSLAIDEILIQNRSTRRFEVQHRTWLGGGVDLKFISTRGEKDEQPQVIVRNNVLRQIQKVKLIERFDMAALAFAKTDAVLNADSPSIRKWIEEGTILFKDDKHVILATEKGRVDVLRANVATLLSAQVGGVLHTPVFVKNGRYLELDSGDGRKDLQGGQEWDSRQSQGNWRPIDDAFLERFSAHFKDAGLDNKHIATRASAVGAYVKNHLKQYVAGVFIAWTDGASLPVAIGPSGGIVEEPLIDGITLLVVPATASNRGRASYKLDDPKVFYATAYSPEVSTSGEWKPCARDLIPIRTPVDAKNKCVYLRLKFDRDFGQYVYKNKAAQLTFSLSHKGVRNAAPFNGEVSIFARMDGAQNPNDRFKLLEEPVAIGGLLSGASKKVKTTKIQFTSVELFTGSSIVLKIQPKADEGDTVPDKLVLENVDLQLVDR